MSHRLCSPCDRHHRAAHGSIAVGASLADVACSWSLAPAYMTQSGQTPDRNPAMQWAPPISLTLSASLFGIRAEAETNGTDGRGSPFSFAKRCLRRTIGLLQSCQPQYGPIR